MQRYSPRTVQAYGHWIRRYLKAIRVRDGSWRRPEELDAADVEWFLAGLATRRKVSARSQNPARVPGSSEALATTSRKRRGRHSLRSFDHGTPAFLRKYPSTETYIADSIQQSEKIGEQDKK